jgi:hypothetical protein
MAKRRRNPQCDACSQWTSIADGVQCDACHNWYQR